MNSPSKPAHRIGIARAVGRPVIGGVPLATAPDGDDGAQETLDIGIQ